MKTLFAIVLIASLSLLALRMTGSLEAIDIHPVDSECRDCHLAKTKIDESNAGILVAAQEELCGGCHQNALTASHPSSGIEFDMDLDEGRFMSVGAVRYDVESAGTRVTWTLEGDMGSSPTGRWFGLFMDALTGPSFERGLLRLKERVESGRRR